MSDRLKQGTLFEMKKETQTGPVTCLGLTFENDDARRAYFTEELRKKLPELKKIEGFPVGEDEDILALSDPPYYTACPNPWMSEVIEEWLSSNSSAHQESGDYHREPYYNDVAIGRSGAIYNAHSYHTKVPHKAIMNYVLHYTSPGDIVLDGFCGTGMTGVASTLCGDKKEVESLGLLVSDNGDIKNKDGTTISRLGARKTVLCDVSPTATSIAYNYNISTDKNEFEWEAQKLINEIEDECSWLFKTTHISSEGKSFEADINFVVWSDDFVCNHCSSVINFWEVAVDQKEKLVKDEFACPQCSSILTKRQLDRSWVTIFDESIDQSITEISRRPVLINYSYNGQRFEKKPDEYDLKLLQQIHDTPIPYWYPTNRMIEGDESRRNDRYGMKYVHQFYTKRNVWIMSCIISKLKKYRNARFFLGALRSSTSYSTKMVKVNIGRLLNGEGLFSFGAVTGTLYVPSICGERPILTAFMSKIQSVQKILSRQEKSVIVTNQSSTNLANVKPNTVDYIFIDPPFGSNLMYSELNFLWESWIKVFTQQNEEAIVNKSQNKELLHYKGLMLQSFREMFRVLKPGRWITVEFSNSQASVWNVLQEALQSAGFIIANVSALDKKQGSFKALTTTTAVKQDLVISAYKPNSEFTRRISTEQNTEESAWIFVKEHLAQLPVFIGEKGKAEIIVERSPRILFDRMIAYHVQNGYTVPISSSDFQVGIEQRFPMRDGMAFLESQVAEYDKKRTIAKEFTQMSLFVADENSAIEWIRQQLMKKPQTRQDLHPNYMKEIQHIAKHEILPELDALLEQNFLRYDGIEDVPSQIHTYLSTDYKDLRNLNKNDSALKTKAKDRWYVPDPNKQADLEKLREKSLLREFETYRDELVGNRKKLKKFRTEAIRAGFKKAWGEKDYQTIVTIGERLPENVLQEDDKLLMYYDNAQIRLGL